MTEQDVGSLFNQAGQIVKKATDSVLAEKDRVSIVADDACKLIQDKVASVDDVIDQKIKEGIDQFRKEFLDAAAANTVAISKLTEALNAYSRRNNPRVEKIETVLGIQKPAEAAATPEKSIATAQTEVGKNILDRLRDVEQIARENNVLFGEIGKLIVGGE